ncbi:hypothetical protein SAMN05428989_2951 [Pseudoxanthomonas sp. GM95]|uniref:hypothetical protein n=1 Tax=Pseudoxanthomonas sp. GM95 TaxID=1881043 RepID=UPI0008D181E0|nr:hypothetical protein [Pseudoxanthomonas sp. GM95]SEL94669.1 hypothetical protein SAMN05428989_2951 [Pseudoxanthomonas sp. GM95]
MGPESGNHQRGEGFKGPQIEPRYNWQASRGGWALFWKGSMVAGVEPDGVHWVTWRGIRHSGHIRSVKLARRCIDRWLAARPPLPPVLKKDLPPSALSSLESFLREYDESNF